MDRDEKTTSPFDEGETAAAGALRELREQGTLLGNRATALASELAVARARIEAAEGRIRTLERELGEWQKTYERKRP